MAELVELGGMIASAILKVVGDQIGSAISGQITLQQNFHEDLEKMNMALESVAAVLKVAERRLITDEPTLLWLKRLKDAMYAISDMIDEFEADTQAITQPSARKFSLKKLLAVIIPCLGIGPKITLANRMKTTREHLEVITSQRNNYNLSEGTNANELRVIDIRETSSIMDAQIIGRTKERDTILDSLSHSMTKEPTVVLSIYGIGGIGKTTLAKMVYNSSQFKEYSQVWVYVSQTFDLNKIGNSIISQLLKKESLYTEKQMIHTSLSELLLDKKVLIVLDDLWEIDGSQLDELKAMLEVGQGSKVVAVVTTRDEHIAKKISSIQPYKLEPLTSEMCWTVIKQKSDFESRDDKKQLEQIGKDIASKCGGVILAAQSLGHMLHSRTYDEWQSVRDKDICSYYGFDNTPTSHALASLRLSYSVMPPSLRLCFAYCAIYPKGHKIVKDDLIHQWISLGFIKEINISSCCQRGERYIGHLLRLSFLQDSKLPSAARVHLEDATSFTMHDLVHDLARLVMDDEILFPGKLASTRRSCCHYALLNDCSKPLESSKIRALRFLNCGEIGLHDDIFSSAKSLRVLDLSECSIHKLPDSIGRLKQLRYLNAPGVQEEMIPVGITMLSKLIYLNLSGSSAIKALPASIGEIEGLVYLDLSGCSGIEHLPESLGKLNKLAHLDLSNCSKLKDVSQLLGSLTELQYLNLSYCKNIGELPRALGGLSKLQYFNLSSSSYLKCYPKAEVLGALTKLEYLNLSYERPYNSGSSSDLVVDFRGLEEVIGKLTKLRYLNLSGGIGPLTEHIQELRSLPEDIKRLLKLQEPLAVSCVSNDQVNNLICHISTLSNLEHLDLSCNDMLSIPVSLCNLTKLHTLNLSRCRYLKGIPESIRKIDSLKVLYVDAGFGLSGLPQLPGNAITLPSFVVHARDGESGSNLFMLKDTNPDELEISRLENVKSTEEAQIIKLVEKQRLLKLKLVWSGDAERFVDDSVLLEKLVPPSTLKDLRIEGYNGVSFPAWLTDQLPTSLACLELCNMEHLEELPEWLGELSSLRELEINNCVKIKELHENMRQLTQLRSLKLWSCSSLASLPHWLGELTSLERLYIMNCDGMRSLPEGIQQLPTNLACLQLCNMEHLEEWNTSYSSSEKEHVIKNLQISDCPKLRMKPLPPRAKWLSISKSDNVLSSFGECASSSSSPVVTTGMCVQCCNVPLHQWSLLHHLPGLTELRIERCSDLTVSPGIIKHLNSLKKLTLICVYNEELLEWLGELSSLRELEIHNCDKIKELHENMRRLTQLQILKLWSCLRLASLPHWLGELTSLEGLYIEYCDGIKSLPEGIQQLANLRELQISYCPELKRWCESEENNMKLAHVKQKDIETKDSQLHWVFK